MDCMACRGGGSIELPLDEILDLLKERLIAYVQQRKARGSIGKLEI